MKDAIPSPETTKTRTECAEETRTALEKLIRETPFLFEGYSIPELRRRADGYVEFAKALDGFK